MLIGLTRPLCRSIGPAEAIPTPPTAPPATPSASAIISATAAQTCSAPPYAGVGRWAVCTNVPAGSARPAAILVPPMSRQRVSISAGGCCRVGAGRRGAHSRGPAPPGRSGARPATPEGAAARGPQQMLGDRAAHLIQRWGGRRRGTPAVLAGTWRGEPQRVAGMVVGHGVVGDRDPRGDGGEQRPRQRIRQHRGGDAADLQPSRRVGQQVRLGGGARRGQTTCGGLGGYHPLGHDQLGEPAPQLASLAGAARRQRGRARSVAQPRFGRVDLVDRYRDTGDGRDHPLGDDARRVAA